MEMTREDRQAVQNVVRYARSNEESQSRLAVAISTPGNRLSIPELEGDYDRALKMLRKAGRRLDAQEGPSGRYARQDASTAKPLTRKQYRKAVELASSTGSSFDAAADIVKDFGVKERPAKRPSREEYRAALQVAGRLQLSFDEALRIVRGGKSPVDAVTAEQAVPDRPKFRRMRIEDLW